MPTLGTAALLFGSFALLVAAGCGNDGSNSDAPAAGVGGLGMAGAPVGGSSAGTGTAGAAAGSAGAAPSGGTAGASAGAASGGSAGSSGAAGIAGAASVVDWVGTWAVSPQSGNASFEKQTLRQIVHTSIAGSEARVQLSNAFGKQALRVSDVHLAKRSKGSSIELASDRALTFGGQASVSIPAGGVAVSDSVAFAVPALADLAVSFYLPDAVSALTYHQQGTQTNYVAAGNVAGAQDLNGAQSNGSYYLLANLDVKNAAALGAVVTLGASITDGVGAGQDSNRRWPNDLAKRLNDAGIVVGVLNQGISGNKLLQDGAGQSALKRFERDVSKQPGVRWVIFSDDPINDLGGTPRPTGAQLIDGLKQLVKAAHAANVKFICSTLTPFQGSGGWSNEGEIARGQILSFVRSAGSGCDGIVDQDGATHDPQAPTKFLPKLHVGDWLHPNEAGLQAIADAVDLMSFK